MPIEPAIPILTIRSQSVILDADLARLYAKSLPFAFTEHGALMAANVLNRPKAVKMSVYVIRAFIKIREEIATND